MDAIAQKRTWQGLPQWADGTFRQKIFWFREGYSWRRDPQPRLEITGHYEEGELSFVVWVTE